MDVKPDVAHDHQHPISRGVVIAMAKDGFPNLALRQTFFERWPN